MAITKLQISKYARKLGANLIGFAPASRWDEYNEVEAAYRPAAIWPETNTVIVLGVPVLLPIIETTPSINYVELYDTTNKLLDQIAYRLAVYLTEKGHGSIFMPRDAYGDIQVLVNKPVAAFSHVFAGKYAGLGTIGYSHVLLNRQYGPRVRYVSVFTRLKIAPDDVLATDLCTKCRVCQRLCPTQAFTSRDDQLIALMDKHACARYHAQLRQEHRYPCGVCAKVCPVGEDRQVFNSTDIGLYLQEKETISKNPEDPRYKRWVHMRRHGSDGERLF
ncbi:epoxyqueuosine reductase [Sporomusa termitida]|uniref:Epoxyqueuosine reductase n=1 Tax=Sporomusa termitida TaxID=2377 RepID=A0A517DX87_9FIRM|nr:epoxyqueuosine reductase [Sporomusa termitida]QDR81856.1 Epoxyqueuosine reductase [Sporomusa termitida]